MIKQHIRVSLPNENTNGWLRQYFPKGSSFKNMTDEELAEAEKRLIIDPESASGTGLLTKSLTQPKVVHLEVEFAPRHL